jgi:glycosyltransferase involved in cell wall biosynthesis
MHDTSSGTAGGEGTSLDIVKQVLSVVEARSVVDAGTVTEASIRSFLDAGAETVYAFEARTECLQILRSTFGEAPSVRLFGAPLGGRAGAAGRTLESLVADGTVPPEVALVSLDLERGSQAVLEAMGQLSSAVVTIAYGASRQANAPTGTRDVASIVALLAARGYRNYVIARHDDGFETALINCDPGRLGTRGRLTFIHDDMFPQLAAGIFDIVAAAQQRLADRVTAVERARDRHIATIPMADGPRPGASDSLQTRLDVLEEQEASLEAYLRIGRDDSMWKWVAPQLGVLYQHDPMPFYVPEHYLMRAPQVSHPSISIVTPTMNSEKFLPHTIASILDQEYPALQYIVQDGGSTDATLKTVDEYGSRIAHVNSGRDSGMSQAINRGFRHATGEIMAYLNSDDLLLPGSLHFAAYYFATHPEVDVLYGHRAIINSLGEEIGRWVLPPHDADVLSWADYVPQETMFWRRRIWEKVGGEVDETFRFALDWDLLLRFREAGARFARVPRFLGAFRVHDEQKTSRELKDLGAREMNRLRERYTRRPVSAEEVWHYLQPYMHRHKIYHKLYRLGVLRY